MCSMLDHQPKPAHITTAEKCVSVELSCALPVRAAARMNQRISAVSEELGEERTDSPDQL